MTAALRFLLAVLAGGITYGGCTVLLELADGPAITLAVIAAALAAWLGPRVIEWVIEGVTS